MSSLGNKIEDAGEAVVIFAVLVGSVAIPIFLGVNTSGLSTIQLTAWGVTLTLALVGIALAFLRHMRAGKGGR
jgi:hypothetical protein